MGNSLSFRNQYDQQGEEVSHLDAENPEASRNSADEQNSSREEEQQNQHGGVYFGNQFIVGSQRILNTDAESILFGGLSSMSSGQRSSFRPSRVHTAPTIKSAINLHKESLKLIKTNEIKELYQIQFRFDTLDDCTIKILLSTGDPDERSEYYSANYPRGLNQTFVVPIEKALDLSAYNPASLIYQPDIGTYPVTITLDIVKDNKEKTVEICDEQPMIESQTTFAAFSQSGESSYEIKPLKVTIQYGGAVYLVHDLYGSDAAGGDADSGRECVICMSDPRDITVWPCNHLCLCSACAELFRFQTDKCPICRSSVKALLKMVDDKKKNTSIVFSGSSTDDSAVDEDNDTPLTLNNRKEIMV
eukprot:TRINITY_DN3577_c0_g1_i1.p1 TRINITY_DN3577_c0_g1~~TRINITY_DN3577_c0_g1_i1.p1  ORF type:complete len:360 (-),score=56.44 TRINITY_DN3577_c0_g1_i1:125-1204(-)